jgi:hypothetical protein
MKLITRLRWMVLPILVAGIVTSPIAKAGPGQDRLATQHFFCNTGYTLNTCLEQIATLQAVVAKYPTEVLGEWTWVLVKSQDWKTQTLRLGLNPNSPAFTCLETRTTFIEEALVAKLPGRASELVAHWHMGMTELINIAVEHEMGHAICHTLNEEKANLVVRILEQNRALSCHGRL